MAEGLEDNIKSMLDSTLKEDNVFESSSEVAATSRDENRGPRNAEMATTIWDETLASKLGNGDCFHNPENLVQFVVSGKSISVIYCRFQ